MEIRANVNDPAANVANERTERSRSREAVPATSFRQAVEEANNDVVRVQRGDTLVSLTRQYLGDAATQLNKGQIYDLAKNLAKENGIHNPDRIMPGQQINMAPMSTLAALKLRQGGVEGVQMSEDSPRTAAPILEKNTRPRRLQGLCAGTGPARGAREDTAARLAPRLLAG